jgi:hypothetical protein
MRVQDRGWGIRGFEDGTRAGESPHAPRPL